MSMQLKEIVERDAIVSDARLKNTSASMKWYKMPLEDSGNESDLE